MAKSDQRWPIKVFAVDLRSLALFRMLLGLVIIADAVWRLPFAVEFTGAAGWLPYDMLRAHPLGSPGLTLHALSAWSGWPVFLLLVQIAVSGAFILGWHTRWITPLLWLLVLSLHARNPFMLQAGDSYLRVVLFWAMFVPLGDRWSLDVRRGAVRSDRDGFFSLGAAGLLIQVALVYVFTGLLKTSPEWHATGQAVYHALQLYDFVTPVGTWLAGYPELLRVLTPVVLWFEIFGPLLLFAPWAKVRGLGILLFIGLQISFGVCLWLALFPFISMVALIPFVPGAFWDGLARRWKPAASQGGGVRRAMRPVPSLLAAIALVLILAENLSALRGGFIIPQGASDILRTVGLRQNWRMFAPMPLDANGYYVWVVKRADGEWASWDDPERPPDWQRPAGGPFRFPTYRLRKYQHNLIRYEYASLRAPYVRYHWETLPAAWAGEDPAQQPVSLALYYADISVRRTPPRSLIVFQLIQVYSPEDMTDGEPTWPGRHLPGVVTH